MRAALTAGINEAALAIATTATTAVAITHGSRADVLYRKLASALEARTAATSPTAEPTTATAEFS